jgi:hypothetical protein
LSCRTEPDALVLRIADELHDTATLSDATFESACATWGQVALLEMTAVAGFYHLVSFVLRTARTPPESWAAPFPEPSEV